MWDISKNHTLWYGGEFASLPVMSSNQPLIGEFLKALSEVVEDALADHCRVFAFRVDLRMPKDVDALAVAFSNSVMSRFMNSLKAKIQHNRLSVGRDGRHVHNTKVRYFWVREVGEEGRVHYHAVVFLNADAFNWLGQYGRSGNMAARVCEAWASALGVAEPFGRALVHFPVRPTYTLRRGDQGSVDAFFYRASYLCKARTKVYGDGHHGYGCSRS